MSATLFFRLLAQDDKAAALDEAIGAVRAGRTADGIVYQVDPAGFRMVPGSPFAYWVSEALRRKFQELPPFEGEGRTVKQGLATADDFRFVRAWWEVPPERILDGLNGPYRAEIAEFQAWCHQRTFEGKRWVPFAKGGEYSPYYADIHLVVNWERDGAEMRAFGPAVIRNPDHYFRPGLTWPLRTNGLSFRALPQASAFGHKGPAAFAQGNDSSTLLHLASVTNSLPFYALVQTLVARIDLAVAFEVGLIQSVPVPTIAGNERRMLSGLAEELTGLRGRLSAASEVTHVFDLPASVRCGTNSISHGASEQRIAVSALARRIRDNQRKIDELAFTLYGISDEDRRAIEMSFGRSVDQSGERDEDGTEDGTAPDPPALVGDLASYLIGCTFGRWDVRFATGQRPLPELPDPFDPLPVCSPGMLVGDDGLPARAAPPDYPLRISWDGILVDDPDHPEDIVQRVREVLALLWPSDDGSKAEAIEREACEILGVKDLREYFRKPALFFAEHLKTYSKSRRQAPIYWPLSTASGSYTLWIYYHRLTSDTLYTAVNRFVEPKLSAIQRELSDLETKLAGASGREASRLREQIDDHRRFLDELRDLRDELLRVAALPYRPDLNDGVIVNAAPLHRLFRLPKWAQATRECWEKLQRGDYDWAHLACTIWPERVREKCRNDRSLAIAHGLEELYEGRAATASGKGRQQRLARPVEDEDDDE